MFPSRSWVIGLGFSGAVLAAVHAYAFRVILGLVLVLAIAGAAMLLFVWLLWLARIVWRVEPGR